MSPSKRCKICGTIRLLHIGQSHDFEGGEEKTMSEVLCVCKVRREAKWWTILDCGHWVKWTGERAPEVGEEFLCPACNPVKLAGGL